jgi:hypothetical protein
MNFRETLLSQTTFANAVADCIERNRTAIEQRLSAEQSDEDRAAAMERIIEETTTGMMSDVKHLSDLMINGRAPLGRKTPKINDELKDFLSHRDFPQILGPAIEIVMRHYSRVPTPISDMIFPIIPYDGMARQINIKSIGVIEPEEVGDGEPYPEVGNSIMDRAWRMELGIKKYGLKVAYEQELMNSDNWGLLGLIYGQIYDGFKINRERRCIRVLNNMGTTIINNKTPSAGVEQRHTSARGIDGSFNGALGLDDVMAGFTYGYMRGYNYSILLIHPFAWRMFISNPELSEVFAKTAAPMPMGSGAPGFEGPFGEMFGYKLSHLGGQNPAGGQYAANGAVDPILGKLGIGLGTDTLTPYYSTFYLSPNGLFPGSMRVILSPHVPFVQDNTTKKYITNVYMIDPTKTGIILGDPGPVTEEWSDKEREINYTKFRMRDAIAMTHQGRGVAVFRNIVIDRSYVFNNVNNVSLPPMGTGPITGIVFP